MRLIVVTAKYDDDANVWYVEESNVPGLRTDAPSIEALRAKLPAHRNLVELNQLDFHGEVPIEVSALRPDHCHASRREKALGSG